MPVNDEDFKTLQDRVREIDTTINGLKFAAAALGLTGAVLAALLLWVYHTALDANSTAEKAKTSAKDALKVTESLNSATNDDIKKINTATDKSISTIKLVSAKSNAEEAPRSDFVAPFLTPEMDWAQGGPPTDLHVRDEEGVCFLTRVTHVTGHLRLHEEEVRIAVHDGEYVLTGGSTYGVVATARCLRFTQPLQGSPSRVRSGVLPNSAAPADQKTQFPGR